VPAAFVRFLESDTNTKLVAKPQIRGVEGQKITMNLGDEIPSELYMAVARILAFVMAAGRPGGPRRPGPSTGLPELPTKATLRARRSREKRDARTASRQ